MLFLHEGQRYVLARARGASATMVNATHWLVQSGSVPLHLLIDVF